MGDESRSSHPDETVPWDVPPDVRRVICRYLDLVQAAFPRSALGFYLYGSVCRGDYVPGWSDVDHLLLLRGTASPPAVDRMTAVYARMTGEFPADEYLGVVIPGRRKDGFCFENELGPGVFGDPLLLEDFLANGRRVCGRELGAGWQRPDRDALAVAAINCAPA